jgi:hypothetical protein
MVAGGRRWREIPFAIIGRLSFIIKSLRSSVMQIARSEVPTCLAQAFNRGRIAAAGGRGEMPRSWLEACVISSLDLRK